MRFAHHLSSHLTPEWRKHYIDYDELKERIYEMVGKKVVRGDEDIDDVGQTEVVVDKKLQEEFFERVNTQVDGVNSFFRTREADALHKLRDLTEEVTVLSAMRGNRRTRALRSTRNKHRSLKKALSEFYLGLALLQNFQQLNHTGFRKVLKKHDKLAKSTRGKELFKGTVCEAYFWKSKHLADLIEKTENMMIDKLEDGNRSKAMNTLRVPPLESKDVRSHWVTLRAGWFMGVIFVSVIVILVAIAMRPGDSWSHVTPTLRGLRVGFIMSLWFYAFAINTFGWRKAGVNNVLIFEFDPRNYLNFVQLFEIASLIGVFFMVGLYLTVFSYWLSYPEWVGPLVMLGMMSLLFAIPIPLFYYRSRIWLTRLCSRIFLAPFFRVNFADFWIADQMNSLAVVFLDLEYFWCFMFYGLHFPDNSIQCGSVRYAIRPLVAVLPAWFRFAQCLRRYRDTRQAFPHLVNAGKYSTSFFVVFFSSIATVFRDSSNGLNDQPIGYYLLFFLWILSAIVSTCYTFTWDIKMDWGLFQGKYKLREELIYSRKLYYSLAVVEDLIFRSLWTLNISVGEAGSKVLEGNILGSVLAIMEVFRRFIWNFFRVENEHLNNCGDFRVVRDISIHPINPSEVLIDDEEGVEPAMRKHLAQEQRRLSSNLVELHGNNLASLRQRHMSAQQHKHNHSYPNRTFTPLEEWKEADQEELSGEPDRDSTDGVTVHTSNSTVESTLLGGTSNSTGNESTHNKTPLLEDSDLKGQSTSDTPLPSLDWGDSLVRETTV